MTAADYPVTFGYGAQDGVYYGPNGSVGLYHRGDDRAMPIGTPVVVNGVQIGLSGTSGASSGPHLHIGRFVNGADTNPEHEGFNLPAPIKVTQVLTDNVNGNYVALQDAQGVRWVYLHLSKQTVAAGQVLQKGDDMGPRLTSTDQVRKIYLEYGIDIAGNNPVLQKWVDDGGTELELRRGIAAQVLNNMNALKAQTETSSGDYVPVGQLYVKKG